MCLIKLVGVSAVCDGVVTVKIGAEARSDEWHTLFIGRTCSHNYAVATRYLAPRTIFSPSSSSCPQLLTSLLFLILGVDRQRNLVIIITP